MSVIILTLLIVIIKAPPLHRQIRLQPKRITDLTKKINLHINPNPRDQLLRLTPDDKPDIVLNVPNVSVDSIDFEINNLSARVAVDASVAQDAVTLFVGVDVHLERVKLTIENVQVCAQLIVRLDNVRKIVERVLDAVDSNEHPSVLGMTQGLLKG